MAVFSCMLIPKIQRKHLLCTPVNKGNGNLVSGASHTRTRRICRRGEGEALCLMSARPSHATAASNGTLI